MVTRQHLHTAIAAALERSRVVVLTGPRQCGKTTLARERLADSSPAYFDLENPPTSLAWPMTALKPLRGLAFMIRQLQPWHANIKKRQVKAPKIYVRDSGLLHQLLGIDSSKALLSHPKLGASWEGFVIEQVLATEPHDEAYFWATHQGAEIDLILRRGDELLGVECKRADAPRLTPSVRIALADLGLRRVAVIHPGDKRYSLADRVEAVPLAEIGNGRPIFPDDAR